MKIRTDFVTNSSSSTFYISKEATLTFVNSGKKYTFSLNKENSKTVDSSGPQEFAKFVNWRYLLTGSKPSISKVVSGKGMKDYAQYLLDNKKETGDFYFILEEKEYSIGYGESIGGDFDLDERDILGYLHPVLAEYYAGKRLFAEVNGVEPLDAYSFWLEKNKVIGDPEGDQWFYKVICFEIDFTEEFYRILYEKAGKPRLDLNSLEKRLLSAGLTQDIIDRMKEQNLQVIYFANKTKKNDVVVYLDEDECVVVQPVCHFLKEWNS